MIVNLGIGKELGGGKRGGGCPEKNKVPRLGYGL